MYYLDYLPDVKKYFKNFHIQGQILNNDIEKKLKRIYKKSFTCNFLKLNIIPIDMIIKELIQNAIKAHIKRWIIKRYQLNPHDQIDYIKVLRILKHILYFVSIEEFLFKISDFDYKFDVLLSIHENVLLIHVINEGKLLSWEEERIRKKFQESYHIKNLYDYYLNYSDTQEGAGMGIAIIMILLRQIGIDDRNFVIFNLSDQSKNQNIEKTISRLYIPLNSSYLTPRKKFEIYKEIHSISGDNLRDLIINNKIYIPFL